jgi:hypothetical protein
MGIKLETVKLAQSSNCPILTPEQLKYGEIQDAATGEMMKSIHIAIRRGARLAKEKLQRENIEMPPPPVEYLMAVAHLDLFCHLCNADPKTFRGGSASVATGIISHLTKIANHYWGAEL